MAAIVAGVRDRAKDRLERGRGLVGRDPGLQRGEPVDGNRRVDPSKEASGAGSARSLAPRGLSSCWSAGRWPGEPLAQGPTVDTSVPALPGVGRLAAGQAPGSGGSSFTNLPGTAGFSVGGPGASTPKGIPTSLTTPGTGPGPTDLQMPITAPQPEPVSPTTNAALWDAGDPVGEDEDDGPPDGLTLDRAIDITLRAEP